MLPHGAHIIKSVEWLGDLTLSSGKGKEAILIDYIL